MMQYEKNRFLQRAIDATNVSYYSDKFEADCKKGLERIVKSYQAEPKLVDFVICATVAEKAEAAIVEGQLIHGIWRQLKGILDLYKAGNINDMGISIQVVLSELNEKGEAIRGFGGHLHDRGDSRLEIVATDAKLQEHIEAAVTQTDTREVSSRMSAMDAIRTRLKRSKLRKGEAIRVDVARTYFFHDGVEKTRLLHSSPRSFGPDWVFSDMEEFPEEYAHFDDLTKKLDEQQIETMLKFCGVAADPEDEETLQEKRMRLWEADREDFYREYRRVTKAGQQHQTNSGPKP